MPTAGDKPAEVRALTGSALVCAELAARFDDKRMVAVVRGSSRSVSPALVSSVLGVEVAGTLPYDPASLRPAGLELARTRRATRGVASLVLSRAFAAPDVGAVA